MDYLRFDHPEMLWLLLLAVAIVWLGTRSLEALDPVRRWATIGLRVAVLLLLVLMLAGLQAVRRHTDLTVVAVARDVGLLSSWNIFVPKDDVIELYQLNADTTGAIWIYLNDIDDATEVMNVLRDRLTAEGYTVMDHVSAPFSRRSHRRTLT